MPERLHIAFVSSELAPWAKTGGLADAVAALPKALARLGHRVTAFLPRYGSIGFPPGDYVGSVHVPVDSVHRSAGFYLASPVRGVHVVFVEHPPLYDRAGGPYSDAHGDFGDNHLRFAFLSRAAIEYFRSRGDRPHVWHAHDWQAGLLPVYLKAFYWDDPAVHRSPTVFTVHNIAYQGVFGLDVVDQLGLPWHLRSRQALEIGGAASFMKGGLLFSEMLTAVSPQYAREIQGHELGYGLDGVVRSRSADLVGILNGVDYDDWDPRNDRFIARRYSADDLAGKAECKADLLRTFGLPQEPDLPVLGITSRLVHQKGFDVVVDAWWDLLQRDMRIVVLGTGERAVEDGFRALAERAPDRVGVRIGYDNALAHQILAGSDVFLMPSRFEPCGLSQMYALRYGAVPLVRSTGGLVDTVEPYDAATGRGTGFRFDHADGTAILWAIDQALATWRDRDRFAALQRSGMAKDFSWDRSAAAYVDVYRRAMGMV